ncbi:MAG TPA: thiamine biosynthesis protein ThiF [Candidatus Copromorpha excrementigallinarum]|uniref:Thiamine biosynthesis protein ThiF n=1 Tax=Candidatus Allocopromorpha excrementigallinarum TaxID=2840742 RepID=A0A9D1I1I2_9FIRM|nr:thiamine biosynthesis protein ThiF [Candidatus Copromorpha excrementigallinarum]
MVSREEMTRALEERHGKELQEKLSAASVAVCGLGGLGSNIAVFLARAGVGRLLLFDFDRVEVSNLHRQQYRVSQVGMYKADAMRENLMEVNPFCRVEALAERITEENAKSLLMEADIVCEAFDEAEAKAMLADSVMAMKPEKYLVAASGMAGLGSANEIKTRKITENFYICGDGKSDVKETMGLVAPRVAVCAGHQAHMALRLLAGRKAP